MQSQSTLRQAVEEQLDLILKIEEERKLLKKQNKTLKEEHLKMLNIIKKYNNLSRQDASIETDPPQEKVPEEILQKHQHIQVDFEQPSLNTSKLSIAQELLRNAPQTLQPPCPKCEENRIICSNREEPSKKTNSQGNSAQVGSQIVKMAKQISSLKRLLLESEKISKNKEKELRELKKCLDVKSQALEKSRKDFNELSKVFNNEKYRSVRALGEELTTVKARLSIAEEESKYSNELKQMLQDVTVQYEAYREDRENRIQRLLSQLKQKDSRCEDLSREMESLRFDNSTV